MAAPTIKTNSGVSTPPELTAAPTNSKIKESSALMVSFKNRNSVQGKVLRNQIEIISKNIEKMTLEEKTNLMTGVVYLAKRYTPSKSQSLTVLERNKKNQKEQAPDAKDTVLTRDKEFIELYNDAVDKAYAGVTQKNWRPLIQLTNPWIKEVMDESFEGLWAHTQLLNSRIVFAGYTASEAMNKYKRVLDTIWVWSANVELDRPPRSESDFANVTVVKDGFFEPTPLPFNDLPVPKSSTDLTALNKWFTLAFFPRITQWNYCKDLIANNRREQAAAAMKWYYENVSRIYNAIFPNSTPAPTFDIDDMREINKTAENVIKAVRIAVRRIRASKNRVETQKLGEGPRKIRVRVIQQDFEGTEISQVPF